MHVGVTIMEVWKWIILSFTAEGKQFAKLKCQNKTHQKLDLCGPFWPCAPIQFSFAPWKAIEQKNHKLQPATFVVLVYV